MIMNRRRDLRPTGFAKARFDLGNFRSLQKTGRHRPMNGGRRTPATNDSAGAFVEPPSATQVTLAGGEPAAIEP